MRKFLWMAAVGVLVLAVASPAMALDFQFKAEYRVRFTALDNVSSPANLGDHNQADRNTRGFQLRVRPWFQTSDDNGNITATLRLEIGDINFGSGGGASAETNGVSLSGGSARVGNGAGGGFGNDGVNVETKWAYIDFAMPFNIPLRVRAGLQPWFLPKGIIVDDDTIGVRGYGTVKPISYEAFWYRLNAGPNTNPAGTPPAGSAGQVATSQTRDDNFDIYGGKLDLALAPFLNPGLYYLYVDNRASNTGAVLNGHFVGVTVTGAAGIISYDLDFVYGTVEGGPAGTNAGFTYNDPATSGTDKVKGWAVDGAVHFPLGPVTINLAGSYATGDKRNGGDSEAFPSLAASWNGAGGGFELIGSGGAFDQFNELTQDSPVNLWTLGSWVTWTPTKPLTLKGGYLYAGFVRGSGNCAVVVVPAQPCFGPSYNMLVNKAQLGHEVHLRGDYTVWTNFKLQGQVGWLIPTAGVTASEYVLQMLYSF